MDPEAIYIKRKEALSAKIGLLLTKKSQLGWGRFFIMIAIVASIYFILNMGLWYLLAVILFAFIFVRLVYADINNNNAIVHNRHLQQITDDELTALTGSYYHFEDGAIHTPHEHVYANDIDLFGRASLFQYINRTTSEMGSAALAEWLLNPEDTNTILKRQDAVKELSATTEWRQELQAFGKEKKIGIQTKERLHNWMQEKSLFHSHAIWKMLQYLLPAIMLAVIALNIFDILSSPVRNYFLLASAILAYFISKKVIPIHDQVSKMAEELSVLSDSIQLIEKATFKSPLLQELHSKYRIEKGVASDELMQLKRILARLDYRLNPVIFIPLAILVQWDLQQVMALERWKKRNQQIITDWFDALGKLEALSSLATLSFNHPEWCFPELKTAHFSIQGIEIGHPLINKNKRVNNAIKINESGELMLITGSNMAGKSTYLRSIGINVVLTMMGSAVCAKSFSLSPVQLITSMRIADNLEENTSTFYAELKKLKAVIDRVNNKEKVFILLDEILRGTNSLDRHTGSVALTKQLIKHNAAGIIATHDVELAKLKEQYLNNILNYHFDAQVSNEELYFDYKLKEGICSSINASILMKKIGIEL
ncbi:MutS family DNA mismatch repair protein [soil metagenome]